MNEGNLGKVVKKVTTGFVIQDLGITPEGRFACTGQEFIAGEVEYEDQFGEALNFDTSKEDYQPFEMVQPNTEILIEVKGGLVQDVKIPSGMNDVTIIVKDYDTDGTYDGTKEDENGIFTEQRWTHCG